jgi:hypothetical protein
MSSNFLVHWIDEDTHKKKKKLSCSQGGCNFKPSHMDSVLDESLAPPGNSMVMESAVASVSIFHVGQRKPIKVGGSDWESAVTLFFLQQKSFIYFG